MDRDVKEKEILTCLGNYNNQDIENSYFGEIMKHRYISTIFIIITSLYCFSNFIIYVVRTYSANENQNIFFSIVLFIICIVFFIFYFRSNTYFRLYFSIYLFYALFCLVHFEINYQLDLMDTLNPNFKSDENYFLKKEIFFLITDLIIKQIWIFLPFNNFLHYFVTSSSSYSFLFYICYLRTKLEKTTFIALWAAFLLPMIVTIVLSLIIQKVKKEKFYFRKECAAYQKNFQIVNVFNSGYVKIKSSNLVHRNDFFEQEKEVFSHMIVKNSLNNLSEVLIPFEDEKKESFQNFVTS